MKWTIADDSALITCWLIYTVDKGNVLPPVRTLAKVIATHKYTTPYKTGIGQKINVCFNQACSTLYLSRFTEAAIYARLRRLAKDPFFLGRRLNSDEFQLVCQRKDVKRPLTNWFDKTSGSYTFKGLSTTAYRWAIAKLSRKCEDKEPFREAILRTLNTQQTRTAVISL